MGGDEIVAESLGDITSSAITTDATIKRFCSGSLRFKTLIFYVWNATYDAYLGKYYADSGEFIGRAFLLEPKEKIKFEYVDLYEFGCKQGSSPVSIKWIGINEY